MVKLATYDELMAGNPSKVEGETLEVIDPVGNIEEKLPITDPNMSFARNAYSAGNKKIASHSNKITIGPKEEPFDPQFLLTQEKAEKVKGGSRKKSLKKRRKTKRKGAGPKSDLSKKRKNKSVSIPEDPISSIKYISNTNQGRVYPADELEAHYDLLDLKIEQKRPISDSDSPVSKGLKKARINKELNRIPPPSPDDSPIQSAVQSPIITEEDWRQVKEILESPEKPQRNIYSLNDINAAESFLEAERERRGKASKRAMKIFREARKGGRKSLKKSKRKGGSGKGSLGLLRKRQEQQKRETQKIYSPNTSTAISLMNRSREEQGKPKSPLRRSSKSSSLWSLDKPNEPGISIKEHKEAMEMIKQAEERIKRNQERIKKANEEKALVEKELEKLKAGRRKSLKKRRKN